MLVCWSVTESVMKFSKCAVPQMSKYIIQEEISIADIFTRSVADPVPFDPWSGLGKKKQDPDPGWTTRIIFLRA